MCASQMEEGAAGFERQRCAAEADVVPPGIKQKRIESSPGNAQVFSTNGVPGCYAARQRERALQVSNCPPGQGSAGGVGVQKSMWWW